MKANRRAKRRSVSRAVVVDAEAKQAAKPTVYDLEDLLIEMLIGSNPKSSNGTDVENFIYSATKGTAELGYDFGFSVGRSMALKLGQESGMAAVLDRIGLKDSTYNPFADEVIITSRGHGSGMTTKSCIHHYEAGVISGYLSASTGIRISTTEKRCIHNGSTVCQFSASHTPRLALTHNGIDDTTDGIAHTMLHRKFSKSGDDYYRVLACVPLLDPKMAEQVAKVMFMAGEKLGRLYGGKPSDTIGNIANYFGASDWAAETRGRKSIIRMRFEGYNSIRSFVAMPAALIAGLYNSRGYTANADFTIGRNGNYGVIISAIRRI